MPISIFGGSALDSHARRLERRVNPRFLACFVGCELAAFVYAVYAVITQNSVAGYAMKLQMDLVGRASENITFMLLLLLPLFAALGLWGALERLVPSLIWTYREPLPEPAPYEQKGHISWKAVLLAAALPSLIGTVISAGMYFRHEQDRKETVYPVSAAALPPQGAKFVAVRGLIERPYLVGYRKTDHQTTSHQLFAPVLAPGWTPADPVRYVVHYETPATYDGKTTWPEAFRRSGETEFAGRIKALPAYAGGDLHSKGLKLDRSCSMVELDDLPDLGSHPFIYEASFVPLPIGGIVSIMLLTVMLMLKFKQFLNTRKSTTARH